MRGVEEDEEEKKRGRREARVEKQLNFWLKTSKR
jgi:hypothetical protein